ncbi:General transcription factor IIH subunit 1 [Araneus ventricosus]|uniref:General transcription factor IIH subunit 1 n=1 Tax=Araneus ventricosus TaxID=182803 RepID=A0A4Y2U3T4_ARAVE|nr:General transcription factor IIH subunit 1 [Araneus ventricosus]
MGSSWQLQDRNGVKERLQQLPPKFKRKINEELEEKNDILSSDPVHFQLYRDLVATHVITTDEFWANYAKKPALMNNHVNSHQDTSPAKSEKDPKKSTIESTAEYDLTSNTKQNVSSLNLTKMSRYLSSPVPLMDTNDISPEEVAMAANHIKHSVHNWTPNLPNVLSPSSAIVALGDVLPSGSLMKNMDNTHLKDSVPIEIQTEMKQLYCALTELYFVISGAVFLPPLLN